LLALAREVRLRAHAPYSEFRVGAVVECRDGRRFTGCNVENSSYGLTICAERTALGKAISEGARDFIRIVVIADAHSPVPPCGACRQVILELCGPDAEVVMANLQGRMEIRTAGELLPAAFDPSFL
jgi:cytidine deaminase